MSDIVEELRQGSVNSYDYRWIAAEEITRLRAEIEDYKRWAAQVTVEANEEVSRLRAENERLREWNREIALNAREFAAENERLRAALTNVMVGGNSLAQIIGADHPPHGTPYGEALAHYGSGVKYEAWCCWNSIMQARAALDGQPAPSGWRPIETAPMGAEPVLLGNHNEGFVEVGHWWVNTWAGGIGLNGPAFGIFTPIPLSFEPTHWMPLPPAPEKEEA